MLASIFGAELLHEHNWRPATFCRSVAREFPGLLKSCSQMKRNLLSLWESTIYLLIFHML